MSTLSRSRRRRSGVEKASRPKLPQCVITWRVSGPCSACGRPVESAHLAGSPPLIYCGRCCVACKRNSRSQP